MSVADIFVGILEYHAPPGSERALFSKFDETNLQKMHDKGRCHFFPSERSPEIFFILGGTYDLADGQYQLLETLTLLNKGISFDSASFADYLKKFGSASLVLIESYNHRAKELLDKFNYSETHYCQQKLLCDINTIAVKTNTVCDTGIVIRKFVLGRDEDAYADLYNELLGFLGTRVDRGFVEAIVQSPTFNHEGYFLAEHENQLIGFFAIEKDPWGSGDPGFGYIYQIGVSEDWKGTGLADCLLQHGIDFARKDGISRIGIGISRNNQRATRFFVERNFKTVFEISGYRLEI